MQTPADGLRRVTREEMKLIDSMATAAYGIPALVLMENAGREVSESVMALMKERGTPGAPVVVFASTGHNGGDGLVAARYLINAGLTVQVLLVGRNPEAATHDTIVNLKILKRMGVEVKELRQPMHVLDAVEACQALAPGAAVDALLGTGFSAITGAVKEPIATAIDVIAKLGVPVVAADIPSGLDGNTGQVIGKAVKADWTVAFGLPKVGFFAPGAADYLGRLTVAHIGFPRTLLDGKAPAVSA